MTPWREYLPAWVASAFISLVIVVVAFAAGRLAAAIMRRRVAAFVRRTAGEWDDVLADELARRIPFWALLVGLYIAAGVWDLTPRLARTVDQALFVLLVLSLTFAAASLAARLARVYGARFEEALPVTSLTENIARILIVSLGVLIILNGLGLSITPLLTALGVGGLAIALALQDTLANLFAGFYVVLARQIRVGDYVSLDSGQAGYVMDIEWRATRIRMLPNNLVLVPNAKLAQSIITNYYLPEKELSVPIEVGVDYRSDLEYVERVTCEVAREVMQSVPGGVPAFEPLVRYHTFGESSIYFSVILRGQEFTDQYLLKHEFVKRLHARYRREGITIPFPTRTILHANPGAGRAAV